MSDLTGLRPIGAALAPVRHTAPVAKALSDAKSSSPSPEGPSNQLRLPQEKALQVDTINQRLAQLTAKADQRGQEVDLKV